VLQLAFSLTMFSHVSTIAMLLLFAVPAPNSSHAYELKCPNLRGDGNDSYRGDMDFYDGGPFGDYDMYKLPAACESAADNTRGKYSTALKPCIFTFHKSDKDDGSSFRTSTVCSKKNSINKETIKEYVIGWPDECVGDFARCYSVDRDENVFRNFFCNTKPDWKIPKDTTHISVSCIDDKEAKIAFNQNRTGGERYFEKEAARQEKQFLIKVEKEEEHMRHLEVVAIISFFLTFSACLILVKCAYSWLLRPYYDKLATHEE